MKKLIDKMREKVPAAIVLTTDVVRVEALRRKLKTYYERTAFTAPDCLTTADTTKRQLLSKLLDDGRVEMAPFEAECKEKANKMATFGHMPFNEIGFCDAVLVINAYNEGDLHKLHGGTGLR